MVKHAVAVIGSGRLSPDVQGIELERQARELGRLIARSGFDLVCGGMGGVMAAACQGVHMARPQCVGEQPAPHGPVAGCAGSNGVSRTIGILPGHDRSEGNAFLDVAVATGLGQMRNYLVVVNSDAVIALSGGGGTLSEIGMALKTGRPVVTVGDWAGLPGVIPVPDVASAVRVVERYFNELDSQE